MDMLVAVIIALLLGVLVGLLVSMIRLHIHSGGTLMFDHSDPSAAPYLCFESYGDLDKVRNKKYVTLAVKWTKEHSRK